MTPHHQRPMTRHDGHQPFPYRWIEPPRRSETDVQRLRAAELAVAIGSEKLGIQPPQVAWFALVDMRQPMHFSRPGLISGMFDATERGVIHLSAASDPGGVACTVAHETYHASGRPDALGEAAAEAFAAAQCRALRNRCQRHGATNEPLNFRTLAWERSQRVAAAASASATRRATPAMAATRRARAGAPVNAFMSLAHLHGAALTRALTTAASRGWAVDLGGGDMRDARELLAAVQAARARRIAAEARA